MAKQSKKSQAERAASAAKAKNPKKKSAVSKKAQAQKSLEKEKRIREVPVRLISSFICLALFILFLVVLLVPEGALVRQSVIFYMAQSVVSDLL